MTDPSVKIEPGVKPRTFACLQRNMVIKQEPGIPVGRRLAIELSSPSVPKRVAVDVNVASQTATVSDADVGAGQSSVNSANCFSCGSGGSGGSGGNDGSLGGGNSLYEHRCDHGGG